MLKKTASKVILTLLLSILVTAGGFSMIPTYGWASGRLEVTAIGVLEQQGENPSQGKILLRNNTRDAGYAELHRILLTFPLDSIRKVSNLTIEDPEFSKVLSDWLAKNAVYTHFVYTSDSTAAIRASVPVAELGLLAYKYDNAIKTRIVTKTTNEKTTTTKKVKSVSSTVTTTNPVETDTIISAVAVVTVSQNTAIPPKASVSDKEAIARGVAKNLLYTSLKKTLVTETTTFEEWMKANPGSVIQANQYIDQHTRTKKAEWNKERTVVTVSSKVELKDVQRAIQSATTRRNYETPIHGTTSQVTTPPAAKNTK